MAQPFISFSFNRAEIANIIKKLQELPEENCNKIWRQSLRTMCTYVIKDTPFGKPELWSGKAPKGYRAGLLKNNWQFTINSPATGIINSKDKSGHASTNSLNQILELNFKNANFKTAYFVNNVPYAYRIEYEGWSRLQRPEGMLRKNLMKFNQILDTFASKYRI